MIRDSPAVGHYDRQSPAPSTEKRVGNIAKFFTISRKSLIFRGRFLLNSLQLL